jgi:adenosylmethionine-8-amino-7-oxononanoate aminotransferase
MSSLLERDKKVIWHPFSPLKGGFPILPVKKASGVYLELEDGTQVLDAISSWWVNMFGHGEQELADAFQEQFTKIDHIIFSGFTHEPAIELAENLIANVKGDFNKAFFSDDGSTAVEVALKIAIQYHHNLGKPKKKVISLDGAYHGDTFGAMSLAGKSDFFSAFNSFFFEVEQIPLPTDKNERHVITQFEKLCKTGEVAVFIFEPLLQGSAGMRAYSAKTLDKLIGIAQNNNVLTIADEVMTGFGRTGKLVAMEYCENTVDLMCLSKGITGGILPLGLTLINEEVVAAFDSEDIKKTFYHGHSYTANPLTCAIAVKSLEIFLRDKTQNEIKLINQCHLEFQKEIIGNVKLERVDVLGTVLAIEIKQQNTSYFNDLKFKIYNYFLERNILLRPLGNVIYIFPPYIITKEELTTIYTAIHSFINELE